MMAALVTTMPTCSRIFESESLILAQNERWRRASDMQVVRESSFGYV